MAPAGVHALSGAMVAMTAEVRLDGAMRLGKTLRAVMVSHVA